MTTTCLLATLVCTAPDLSAIQQRKAVRHEVIQFVSESDFDKLYTTTMKWKKLPHSNKALLLDCLIEELESTSKPGLKNTADLIIPYRLRTKDLEYYGHGSIIIQDIFLAAGKAAHGIDEILGRSHPLPEINEGQTPEERKKAVAEIRETVAAGKTVFAFLTETDYPTFQAAVDGWKTSKPEARSRYVALLLPHLRDTTLVKPVNHLHKITICYRVGTGDVERTNVLRENRTDHDLFTVGGKAAWAIGQISGLDRELPEITPALTRGDLELHDKMIRIAVAAYQAGLKHGSVRK